MLVPPSSRTLIRIAHHIVPHISQDGLSPQYGLIRDLGLPRARVGPLVLLALRSPPAPRPFLRFRFRAEAKLSTFSPILPSGSTYHRVPE